MSFELAPKGKRCPFFGGTADCRDNVTDGTCTDSWQHIAGENPLTGERLNKWGCSLQFAWLFAADAARRANEASKDVETLRNMIFDPVVRAKELAKANTLKTIEDKSNAHLD